MLVAANIIILFALLTLLLFEEIRFRRVRRAIQETREELTAIAHVLRSPLAALKKYTAFLQQKEFGELSIAQQEMISRLQSAVADTVVHVDRLIARSRIEEGRISSSPAVIPIHSSIEGAVHAIEPIASARKQRVRIEGCDRSLRIFADPLLFHGVLDELLLNAVNYMKPQRTATVHFHRVGRKVRIDIEDKGIGILPEERAHIFEKFFRGERASKMAPGNGLGLSFAAQFAQHMGGKITFSARAEKGSIFTVILPAHRP